ncbi:MAG: ribbon-helix-helix domain-containing protein [Alphaproteobacteria bacterium]|nr:ribbon-helix-helix domain-containing protein [Alphaproteobacteria bacterium]
MIGPVEIVKRSVRIAGHATSVSLEPAFWEALNEIAVRRRMSLNALLSTIDAGRRGNLSSAIRLFVLARCRDGELGDLAGASPLTCSRVGEAVRGAGGPA